MPDMLLKPDFNWFEWLRNEMMESIGSGVPKREAVLWFMQYAFNNGQNIEKIVSELQSLPELQKIACSVPETEVSKGKPKPELPIGTSVEVILNKRNSTYHIGNIMGAIWHHKEACWNYYLNANGKKISKRYLAIDLQEIEV